MSPEFDSVAATNAVPLTLLPHPDNPPMAVGRVSAEVRPLAGGALQLQYRVDCAQDVLRPVQLATPGFADGLWRHTCFEAFLAPAGAEAYREFNFSADGRWAGYRFGAWRARCGDLRGLPPPRLKIAARGDGLNAEVVLPAALLDDAEAIDLGLTAVLERHDGVLSYWALAHAPGPADFHWRAGFCYRLARDPGGEQR